jgi:hypothetical protein
MSHRSVKRCLLWVRAKQSNQTHKQQTTKLVDQLVYCLEKNNAKHAPPCWQTNTAQHERKQQASK